MIEIRDYSVSMSGRSLLDSQSLCIQSGSITGLVAPNGSGKTTFMRSLCGASDIQASGEVRINGKITGKEGTYRREIFYVPGDASILYPLLTVRDNLLIAHSCWRDALEVEDISERCHIRSFLNKRVCRLSLGMKQQVSLAIGYMVGARYLLLDEPMNALDPTNLEINSQIICELRDSGTGILMSSHILGSVDELADRVVFIKDGKFVCGLGADSGTKAAYKQLYG
ncbi:MAG: ABC transporter ATP-binding protein [Coriobacteriaceae bacterium]|nr:ABC transporter ATP-binding protein [Coriobacteriaceae bacterium]